MVDFLQKIAARYDLKYQNSREGDSASGYIGMYPATMKETSSPRTLGVHLWATCENAEEEPVLAGFLSSLAAASDGAMTSVGWSGDNADRFGAVSLVFRNLKGEEESTELFLTNTLGRLRTFLEEHHFIAKCGLCAGTENVGVYLVDGLYGVSHCRACNENWLQEVKEAANVVRLSPAEWAKGIFGSLLGAFFGVIIWMVVHRAGYTAAICGLLIAGGSINGFAKRVKKQNMASVCVQIFIFIAACIFAEMFCLVIDLREAWSAEHPGLTFLQVAYNVPYLLWEVPEVGIQVLGNLFVGMFFGGLASYGMFRKAWFSSQHGVSCTEMVSPRT